MSEDALRRLSGLGERIAADGFASVADYINYLKHCHAYRWAAARLPGKRVLDLGCGTGFGTAMLAASAADVQGLDLDPEVIHILNETLARPNLRFLAYDGRHLPFADATFDGVISLQVIEHVEDVPAYLREIHRVLTPGGQAILTTPNRRIRLLPGQKPWNPYHLREYMFEEMQAMLNGVFSRAQGYSMRASPEITALDLNRVRQRPLQVYVLNPVKQLVKRLLRYRAATAPTTATPPSPADLQRYSVDDFEYVAENLPQALDLLFCCEK